MIVYRSTRYRIYPTPAQEARLRRWQDALRWLWNLAHEQRLMGLARPKDERVYVSYADQSKQLPELRSALPWLADVPAATCQSVLRELDKAWQRCFRHIARKPRWKAKNERPTAMVTPDPANFHVRSASISLPKLGPIQASVHRVAPGQQKRCDVILDVDQWFAMVTYEVEIAPLAHPGPAVGLDRGVVNVVADSDGRMVRNQRCAELVQSRIARAQRSVGRKQQGSANHTKAVDRLAKLHRSVRRKQDHALHVESKYYACKYGTIVLEKLDVASMSASAKGTVEAPGRNVRQKAGLNRAIASSGWSGLLTRLRYKTEERGGHVIEVPPEYTSQTCSACGHVAAENRASQAAFVCVSCGHAEHADVNAAKVILARGLAGQVAPPKAPKKSLRVVKRARKSSAAATPTAAVPAAEACGGDPLVTGPDEAGRPRRETWNRPAGR